MPELTPDTLFSRDQLYQSWLDVEAALARAQARLGMIPDWAADGISRVADLGHVGREAIDTDAARTMAPILSLTRLLAKAAGKAGDYVHWGATTQNVMQTGRILLLRRADAAILDNLARVAEGMGRLAKLHATTLMAGRTNRRHALPITFGFKVAGWIEELDRTADRMSGAAERCFALPFGGAVGAMHAYGGQGRDLNRLLAADLGLRELMVAGRTVNDLFVEYILQLCMLGMAVERVAGELYRLMGEEVGEIEERLEEGTVGSSTMPNKVNPKYVVRVLAQCAQLRSFAVPALESGLSKHEGDAVANHLLAAVTDRAVPLAWRLAEGFADLLDRVRPVPQRMAENLALTDGGIAAERLMMQLAPTVGRARAHDIVHHALDAGLAAGMSPLEALLADTQIAGLMRTEDIATALDPSGYTGDSAEIAHAGARLAETLAARLRSARGGTSPIQIRPSINTA